MKLLGGRSLWPSFINFIENFSLLISSCRGPLWRKWSKYFLQVQGRPQNIFAAERKSSAAVSAVLCVRAAVDAVCSFLLSAVHQSSERAGGRDRSDHFLLLGLFMPQHFGQLGARRKEVFWPVDPRTHFHTENEPSAKDLTVDQSVGPWGVT